MTQQQKSRTPMPSRSAAAPLPALLSAAFRAFFHRVALPAAVPPVCRGLTVLHLGERRDRARSMQEAARVATAWAAAASAAARAAWIASAWVAWRDGRVGRTGRGRENFSARRRGGTR